MVSSFKNDAVLDYSCLPRTGDRRDLDLGFLGGSCLRGAHSWMRYRP